MKTNSLKIAFPALAVLLFQTGCTSLYSIGPSAIVESPEVMNSETGEVSFFARLEPGQRFYLVSDASSRPLNPKNPPELKEELLLTAGANVALTKQIEAGAGVDLFGIFNRSLLTRGQLKAQLIGNSSREDSPTPHRFAIYGHPILGAVSTDGDQDGTFGPGGYPWRAKSEFRGLNYGATYGYRFSDKLMVYTGAAKEDYSMKASVTHEEGRNNSPRAFARIPKSTGSSVSYALGLVNTGSNRFNGAVYYIENKWSGQKDCFWFLTLGVEIDKLKEAKTSPSQPSQ